MGGVAVTVSVGLSLTHLLIIAISLAMMLNQLLMVNRIGLDSGGRRISTTSP